jgi:hypothetical protein
METVGPGAPVRSPIGAFFVLLFAAPGTVLKFFAEFCDFGAEFLVTLTHLFELLFETGITVGRAAMTSLLVMAFHFFGTDADTAGFVVQSGLLKVHGCGHEMGNGLGTAVVTRRFFSAGHIPLWPAFTRATFTRATFTSGWHFTAGPIALRASFAGSVHAGGAIGAPFTTGLGTIFGATFGFFGGASLFGTRFGTGFFLLGVSGQEGKSEGGGDSGTEEGAGEFQRAGDDHVGRYLIFFAKVRNLDDS